MKVVLDIEGNGLLETVTKVHCMSIRCGDTGELLLSCADQPNYKKVHEGLEFLDKFDEAIGHNLDGYDMPALKKVLDYTYKGKVTDTLVMTRLAHSNLFDIEINSKKTAKELGYKHGSHSLKAWGVRIGELKADFGDEEEDKDKIFETWTPEMQEYMDQDTLVNYKLYKKLLEMNLSEKALEIEHEFNRIIQQQMFNGVAFDTQKALALKAELEREVGKIESWVKDNIQPKIISLKTKEKVIPFNIGSTDQVAEYFTAKYGWEAKYKTPTGKPQVNGDILASLPYPEARIFKDYNDRAKILGFINEGSNSWLKAVKENGRIYSYVNSNGQVSGRVTMSKPNVAQIPTNGAYKGVECRSLFVPRDGYSFADCDAAGIQLRVLGHYLANYDNGEYARLICEGDVHERNRVAAGLETRPQAKEFIYAFLFGGGQQKLGSIAKPDATEEEQRAIGKALKNKFLEATPAINDLSYDCKRAFNSRGSIKSLDGRLLFPREDYRTLNTLLQGGEAVIMKLANCIADRELKRRSIDFYQVLFIHDQIVLEVRDGQEVEAGEIVKESIRKAGEELKLNIPLDGAYKVGKSWDQTH